MDMSENCKMFVNGFGQNVLQGASFDFPSPLFICPGFCRLLGEFFSMTVRHTTEKGEDRKMSPKLSDSNSR
jgi:hypothetical protein